MLIEEGARVNLSDPNGTTALHYAVQFKSVDLIKLLIDNDADITIKDNKDLSPWDYALLNSDENILKILKK
jgi:ankyrin repeat protein